MLNNNFHRLQEEDLLEQEADSRFDTQGVRSGVLGHLGMIKLIGDMINMFVPKVIEALVTSVGGHNDKGNSKKSSHYTPPSQTDITSMGRPDDILPKSPDGGGPRSDY